MYVIAKDTLLGGDERRLRIEVLGGKIVVRNVDTDGLVVDRSTFGFEQHLWNEVERLRGDLALLGPVTTPTRGVVCASCGRDTAPSWTYCPGCGAQGRKRASDSVTRKS